MDSQSSQAPVVLDKKVLYESKFLKLVGISYQAPSDEGPKIKAWQSCERTTTDPSRGIDGK